MIFLQWLVATQESYLQRTYGSVYDQLVDREIDVASRKFTINPYILALFFGGLLVFTIGIGLILFKPQAESDVQIISSNGVVAGDKTSSEIMVHVDGAVARPAVYKLPADARVDDAIKAAGGMTTEADTVRVNLAAKLVDGQKVIIPGMGEVVISDKLQVINSTQSGLININTGSQAELESLPGIGPVTAQKIISARPYVSVEELLTKKVVSNSVYHKVKDLVSL